jgi:preprotein translocase subunit YajC
MPIAIYLGQATPPQPPRDDPTSTFVLFGAIMVIMWVLIDSAAAEKAKELAARISALKTGTAS